MSPPDQDLTAVATLADPMRRRLYEFVCTQAEPVGRDQAAAAMGISRHQAKFHLDRLEADGLLASDYARLTGRTGPGAGRTAKRYRPLDQEISVTIPARDYGLAAHIMADAIADAEATGRPIGQALEITATAYGVRIGRSPDPGSADSALERVVGLLSEHGYQPSRYGDVVQLTNCPFHRLAHSHTELVCGMNHALIVAIVDTAVGDAVRARLDPGEDRCCVTLDTCSCERSSSEPT